jgi:hypothetical protein
MSPSLARDLAQAGLLEGPGPRDSSDTRDASDLTIAEWCALRRISRSMFYKMRRLGIGPEVTFYGGTIPRITREADRRWREAAPTQSSRSRKTSTTA